MQETVYLCEFGTSRQHGYLYGRVINTIMHAWHLRFRVNLLQIKLYYDSCDFVGYRLIDDPSSQILLSSDFSLANNYFGLVLPRGLRDTIFCPHSLVDVTCRYYVSDHRSSFVKVGLLPIVVS